MGEESNVLQLNTLFGGSDEEFINSATITYGNGNYDYPPNELHITELVLQIQNCGGKIEEDMGSDNTLKGAESSNCDDIDTHIALPNEGGEEFYAASPSTPPLPMFSLLTETSPEKSTNKRKIDELEDRVDANILSPETQSEQPKTKKIKKNPEFKPEEIARDIIAKNDDPFVFVFDFVKEIKREYDSNIIALKTKIQDFEKNSAKMSEREEEIESRVSSLVEENKLLKKKLEYMRYESDLCKRELTFKDQTIHLLTEKLESLEKTNRQHADFIAQHLS